MLALHQPVAHDLRFIIAVLKVNNDLERIGDLAANIAEQGRYVAKVIRGWLRNRMLPPFRYRDFGTMATIGRAAAVAEIGPIRLAGFVGWLAWLFIHLIKMVEFKGSGKRKK